MEGNEAGGLTSASYYHHHHHHHHNNNHNGNGIFSNNPEALRYPSSDPTPPIFSHSLGPTPGPEPVPRRKRGRPRKYGPGGSASGDPSHKRASSASSSLPLSSSPSSAPPHLHKKDHSLTSLSSKKAQLVALGNAGQGFTPHVIMAAAGEDVAQKIMSFMQQGKRAVCIISASGSISNASLRQPAMLGGNVTYEGRFEILSLSGSFLHTEMGGASSRTGGLSICLSGSDGRIVGGGVGGFLKAAGPVQVIAGSFVYDGKRKITAAPRDEAPTPLVGLAVSPVRFRSAQDSSARISSRIKDGHQDIEASSFMIQPRGMHGISPRSTDWRVSHIEHDGRVFTGQADGGAYQSPEEGDDDDHIGD